MSGKSLKGIEWYRDISAINRKEPGIVHSFAGSLAAAVNYVRGNVDPAQLMGDSGFAFRIWVNQTMCPSAMSIFTWKTILPDAVEQAGYVCRYYDRMWGEEALEEERRMKAQEAVIRAIEQGIPAIVWDIAEAEWGLIIRIRLAERCIFDHDISGREFFPGFREIGEERDRCIIGCHSRRR